MTSPWKKITSEKPPTNEDITLQIENAKNIAMQQGLTEGREQGLLEGKSEIIAEVAKLENLVNQVEKKFFYIEKKAPDIIMEVCSEILNKIVDENSSLMLLEAVKKQISDAEEFKVLLNPDDTDFVKDDITASNIQYDPRVYQGEARVIVGNEDVLISLKDYIRKSISYISEEIKK